MTTATTTTALDQLNIDQLDALDRIQTFLAGDDWEFRLAGLAGTGKTWVTAALPEVTSGLTVWYLAPTGRAARNLTTRLPVGLGAMTIHRAIYEAVGTHCSRCPARLSPASEEEIAYLLSRGKIPPRCHGSGPCGCEVQFRLVHPARRPDVIVVDEASMVGSDLHHDLRRLMCKIIFVGDHGQLPPVGEKMGMMERHDYELTEVLRQDEGSDILELAMAVRQGARLPKDGSGSVRVLTPREVASEWAEADALPMSLTHRKIDRVQINGIARRSRGLSGQVRAGERVVGLRNNYETGVTNGAMAVVRNVAWHDGDEYLRISADLDDGVLYQGRAMYEQFDQPGTLPPSRGVDQWDFGYCLTVHKAQGTEADDVAMFVNPWSLRALGSDEVRRWHYTAVTRAKKRLTIVPFKGKLP